MLLPTFVAPLLGFQRIHRKLHLVLAALIIVAPQLCRVILGTGYEFIPKKIWTLVCSFCGIIFDAVHSAIARACTAWQGFEIKLANSVNDTLTSEHIRPG